MTGNELRDYLIDNGYILVDIAEKLGTTPQNLQNRLNVKKIKKDFLRDVANAIDMNEFTLEKNINKINNSTVVGGTVNGDGNHISNNDVSGLIDLLKKKDEQMDRLLTILENTQNKNIK